eukprot:6466264-Amphidinium_carterae.1
MTFMDATTIVSETTLESGKPGLFLTAQLLQHEPGVEVAMLYPHPSFSDTSLRERLLQQELIIMT